MILVGFYLIFKQINYLTIFLYYSIIYVFDEGRSKDLKDIYNSIYDYDHFYIFNSYLTFKDKEKECF